MSFSSWSPFWLPVRILCRGYTAAPWAFRRGTAVVLPSRWLPGATAHNYNEKYSFTKVWYIYMCVRPSSQSPTLNTPNHPLRYRLYSKLWLYTTSHAVHTINYNNTNQTFLTWLYRLIYLPNLITWHARYRSLFWRSDPSMSWKITWNLHES